MVLELDELLDFFTGTVNGMLLNKEETEDFITSLVGTAAGDSYEEVLMNFIRDMKDIGCTVALTF